MTKKLLTVISLGIAACWLGIALAGDINYGGSPADGSGMPTFQEVYDYLMDGTAETTDSTFQEPSAAPGSTMKTTRNIYDDIKAEFDQCASATPDKVQSGVKFFSTDTLKWGVQTGTMPLAAVPETGQTLQYDTNTPKADDGGTDPLGTALPSPRFTPNITDGSVTDNLTGLIWGPDANLINTRSNNSDDTDGTVNNGRVYWQTALDFVAILNSENYLGHTDWRLPTIRELHSLVNFKYNNPALTNDAGDAKWNTSGVSSFSNVVSNYYWSSTSYSGSTALAWNVSMNHGYVDDGVKLTGGGYVWPVRGGQ